MLSYNVQYLSDGSWISIVGESTHFMQTEAMLVGSLVAGQSYSIRIRALNVYGWSNFEPEPHFEIASSGIP